MFSIVKSHGVRFAVSREIAPLGVALVTAEGIYKFHSFSLECLAFLGTWFALSALWNLAYDFMAGTRGRRAASTRA